MDFIFFILIGALAGYIAGRIMKGEGFGFILNIIIGIVGASIGGWLFGLIGLNLGGGIIGSLITAIIGAVVLLYVINLFRKKK